MQSGRERLRAWVERSKVNQNEAAAILGVNPVMLSEWLNGVKTPGLMNAILIEDVTGISVRSWGLNSVRKVREPELATAGNRRFAKR